MNPFCFNVLVSTVLGLSKELLLELKEPQTESIK